MKKFPEKNFEKFLSLLKGEGEAETFTRFVLNLNRDLREKSVFAFYVCLIKKIKKSDRGLNFVMI